MSFKIAEAFVEVSSREAAGSRIRSRDAGKREGEDFGRSFKMGFNEGSRVNQLGRDLRDVRTIWQSSIGPIQNWAKSVGMAAVKAGALSAGLIGGVGLVGAVLSLVGTLTQAVGVLPALALGFLQAKAAAAVLKVGLLGVGDALKKDLSTEMAKLSPQAKSFVDTFKTLIPVLGEVKRGIQDHLFDGLSKEIRPLAQTYLPLLKSRGEDVADVFNFTLRQAFMNLGSVAVRKNVQTTLDGIVASVQNIVPHFARIPTLFFQMSAQITPVLNKITAELGGLLETGFGSIERYLDSGKLAGAVETGFSVVKNIGATIFGIFSTIHGLATAAGAAFGDVLSPIKSVVNAVARYVNSAGGQAKITALFKEAQPVLAKIGQLVGDLLGRASQLWPVVLKLADAFLTALGPVIPIVVKLIGQIGNALADVLPAVGQLATALGGALSAALTTLAPIIPVLATAFANLLGPFGIVQSILDALAPVLPTLVQGIADVATVVAGALSDAITDLAPIMPDLVDAFVDLATAFADALAPILPDIADAFVDLMPAIKPVLGVITDMVSVVGDIIDALGPVAPALIAVTAAIWLLNFALDANPIVAIGVAIFALLAVIVKNWAEIVAVTTAAWELVKSAVSAAWDWILAHTIGIAAKVVSAVTGAWDSLKTKTSVAWDGIKNAVSTAGRGMVSFAVGLPIVGPFLTHFTAIKNGVTTKMTELATWFKGLPGRLLSAVGDLGTLLYDAGRRVISGFIDGIKSKIGELLGTLGNINSMIPLHKGPPERDARMLTPAGQNIMGGLIRGIQSRIPDLRSTLGGVTAEVSGGLAAGPVASAGVPGGTTYSYSIGTVEIRASDLQDIQDIRAFFERIQQVSRSHAPVRSGA